MYTLAHLHTRACARTKTIGTPPPPPPPPPLIRVPRRHLLVLRPFPSQPAPEGVGFVRRASLRPTARKCLDGRERPRACSRVPATPVNTCTRTHTRTQNAGVYIRGALFIKTKLRAHARPKLFGTSWMKNLCSRSLSSQRQRSVMLFRFRLTGFLPGGGFKCVCPRRVGADRCGGGPNELRQTATTTWRTRRYIESDVYAYGDTTMPPPSSPPNGAES